MSKHKQKAEKGFFDEESRRLELAAHRDPLRRLNEAVDWEIFRPTLHQVFEREAKGKGGCPPYDYVKMFKVLILQRTFNLADGQTEYQLKDRLSFQGFLGLTLADGIPDEKTIWLFREKLTKKGGVEELFKRFDAHLRERGLILNKGAVVDASFVEVPRQRNSREENAEVKEGRVPKQWEKEPAKLAQKDVDARWTKKNEEKHYGYKDHVKIDSGSKIITNYVVTSAEVHDSQVLEELVEQRDAGRPLYGDSAYGGEKQEEVLERKEVKAQINERAYRNSPLTPRQKENNRQKSRIRARVEHVFGFIENSMGGSYIRSIGLRRGKGIIGLMNLTYNAFRLGQLLRLKVSGG
jgi:IS5 family transposase